MRECECGLTKAESSLIDKDAGVKAAATSAINKNPMQVNTLSFIQRRAELAHVPPRAESSTEYSNRKRRPSPPTGCGMPEEASRQPGLSYRIRVDIVWY